MFDWDSRRAPSRPRLPAFRRRRSRDFFTTVTIWLKMKRGITLAKLDIGDLSFAPDYFGKCYQQFEADPKSWNRRRRNLRETGWCG